jgi:hypothetical protein
MAISNESLGAKNVESGVETGHEHTYKFYMIYCL